MNALPPPSNRDDLIALLTEACELEHGLACSYLYAAFSLKQRPEEGGLDNEQLRRARFWAAQVFFIAGQEMLHLAQAWNLLAAIGGAPYVLRPNLPQNSRYYPLGAAVALEPFGERSLKRFILYETPAQASLPWVRQQASLDAAERSRGHVSIGELYAAIAEGFGSIAGLFVGDPANQVGQPGAQFYDLVRVTDSDSAVRAIEMIVHQGEGSTADRDDSHYGMFLGVLNDYRAVVAAGGAPVRQLMANPVADTTHGYGAAAHPIKDARTRAAAELFDHVYGLMLQALAFGFAAAGSAAAATVASQAAIELMTTVIRPLGDALCTLPAGVDGLNGG